MAYQVIQDKQYLQDILESYKQFYKSVVGKKTNELITSIYDSKYDVIHDHIYYEHPPTFVEIMDRKKSSTFIKKHRKFVGLVSKSKFLRRLLAYYLLRINTKLTMMNNDMITFQKKGTFDYGNHITTEIKYSPITCVVYDGLLVFKTDSQTSTENLKDQRPRCNECDQLIEECVHIRGNNTQS